MRVLFVGDIHTHDYMIEDIKRLDNKYNFITYTQRRCLYRQITPVPMFQRFCPPPAHKPRSAFR